MTPDGKHIGTLVFPEQPANLVFGDADGRTLYVTARTSLYRMRLNIAGIDRASFTLQLHELPGIVERARVLLHPRYSAGRIQKSRR